MEFEINIGPQGHIYLPKCVRKTLGKNLKLQPNTTTAILYPTKADPRIVVESLQLIINNLNLRIRQESEEQ